MIEILLVEDNPADVRLTQEALRESQINNHLNVVDDGDEAMLFLQRQGQHASAPRPDLILLDFNLPKGDGLDVLRWIKSEASLRSIPVVVLTSSTLPEDAKEAYASHANAFISKPVHFDEFLESIQKLGDYWLPIISSSPES